MIVAGAVYAGKPKLASYTAALSLVPRQNFTQKRASPEGKKVRDRTSSARIDHLRASDLRQYLRDRVRSLSDRRALVAISLQ